MTDSPPRLLELLPPAPPVGQPVDAEALYDAFATYCAGQGITPYPHQEEAALELFTGANVILSTPTGSGKSLAALAAHFHAVANNHVTFYTAPVKALVNEKFFALVDAFGAENVGMLTGDASVNPDAQVICCTAEILANIALREGASADVGVVVMDEFHFYAEPDRGWAWQVPLLELPQAQFLLMSATLGNTERLAADLTLRTGRTTATITGTQRPVPLHFEWAMTPVTETIEELVASRRTPAYIVHFTQKEALERAQALATLPLASREQRDAIAARLVGVRFAPGFGRTIHTLLRRGIGVHHAGMLPRYRRLVEQLAQLGLLTVICGTDTLGVGINVPIRTVLFTGLAKYDGSRSRILRNREFHQIAGRAGRAGYDTQGYVVVQAPEHVIENARLVAKAGDDPKKLKKLVRRKPPEGSVVWTEETFARLVSAEPETLVSRMRVTHSTLVNVLARPDEALATMSRLTRENHETPTNRAKLARRAVSLFRGLVDAGLVERTPGDPSRWRLTVELPDSFALNQPLSAFALAAFELLDPSDPTYHLDVISIIEATLEDPLGILLQQQWKARGEAVAQMKADGMEYEERMEELEQVSWPKPLADLLEGALQGYRRGAPWVPADALKPKSVVRDMVERGMGFAEYVAHYGIARLEGVLLRYLSDAFRALRTGVPEVVRTPELDEVIEWLGETIRQVDSSLLDEWEALAHPENAGAHLAGADAPALAPPGGSRPLSANARALTVMVRNAMWRRVALAARDDVAGLAELEALSAGLADPPLAVRMDRAAWDDALEAYFDEHDELLTDADARSPARCDIQPGEREWTVTQVLADPDGNRDWRITAVLDVAATDAAGEAVVLATGMTRLGG